MRTLIAVLLLSVLLAGCSKPMPPTITPERAEIVATSPSGLVIRVHCKAHNPNSIPLPIRTVEGNITLAGTPLGGVSASSLTTLAANTDTAVPFELSVPWSNVMPALLSSASQAEIPYTVQGTAHFEVAGFKASVPFTTHGRVRKSELIGAAMQSLPPVRLPGGFPQIQ